MTSVQVKGIRAAQKKHWNFIGQDGTKIKTFIDAYSDAGIIHASRRVAVVITASEAANAANLDVSANIYGRNVTLDKPFRFVIPAPKGGSSAVITEMTDDGERVTAESGAAIVAAWRTANDISDVLEFEYGTITEKP